MNGNTILVEVNDRSVKFEIDKDKVIRTVGGKIGPEVPSGYNTREGDGAAEDGTYSDDSDSMDLDPCYDPELED